MAGLVDLDTTALLPLVVAGERSGPLRAALEGRPGWVTSALAGVELRRAARLAGLDAAGRERVEDVLACRGLLTVDARTLPAPSASSRGSCAASTPCTRPARSSWATTSAPSRPTTRGSPGRRARGARGGPSPP